MAQMLHSHDLEVLSGGCVNDEEKVRGGCKEMSRDPSSRPPEDRQ